MKNFFALTCGIIAMGVVLLTACKKKNADNSVRDNVVGTWTSTNFVIDSNDNGVMDANEFGPCAQPVTYTFNSDGTISIPNAPAVPQGGSITWTLINNNADVKVVGDSVGVQIYTATYHIVSPTEWSVAGRYTLGINKIVACWDVYKKQ